MTPPSPLSPLAGADREMPHEPSRLLVAGDLHADESWFENLVYYAREQRCQAILQLGDLGYWPRIKHCDDFLRSLPRQLEGADLDLYFVEGNHEDLDALFDTDFPQVGPFRKIEERVYHLPRGAQWRWHGLRFVSVGGGYSLDKELRIPGYDWFERETLSEGELHAILEERGEIDVLVSHDCPARVALELGMLPIAASLSHRRALATIVERMRPALCLHGHLHRTHRTLWEDEESGVRCLVIGLADETQRSANVRVFDLAELAALVGRIRGGEAP